MRNREDWDESDGLEVPGQVHRTYRSSRRKKRPRLNPRLLITLVCLAVGVAAISSTSMLIVSLLVAEPVVSVILAALTGACLGFMPYNMNPAKIFMGDVGSQLLGFVLATASIMGLFKMHAVFTFFVPMLSLALPLTDTLFAFCRRISHGQSPFHADRGHFHHRLLAMGLSQRQAVAVLYTVSGVMGLLAVMLAAETPALRIICLGVIGLILVAMWAFVFHKNPNLHMRHPDCPTAAPDRHEDQ